MYKFKEKLLRDIGKDRYEHSLRVSKTSRELAHLNNIDTDKAEIAGLLHDCAKYPDETKILKKSKEFGIIGDIVSKTDLPLIHAPLSSLIAEKEYGITDVEVLNAIKYHTVGREDMTTLEKIVYLSDYIEPMRKFPGVENVRNLVQIDLDEAMIKSMDQTIIFLINKGLTINKSTIDTRNKLILSKHK